MHQGDQTHRHVKMSNPAAAAAGPFGDLKQMNDTGDSSRVEEIPRPRAQLDEFVLLSPLRVRAVSPLAERAGASLSAPSERRGTHVPLVLVAAASS